MTPRPTPPRRRIAIVGASLAGLRAAEALRAAGFAGDLTLVGDEPHPPYDRPPLSKGILSGSTPAARTGLARFRRLDAAWRLGIPATGLDLAAREVWLGDRERLPFDALVVATGVRARSWPVPSEAALDGVVAIRTRDDAANLRARLASRPGRVLIVGGGFIGCEVAAVCRDLGIPVTLVVRGDAPLAGPLGPIVGAVAADLLRDHGVDLRTRTSVVALEGDARGRLRRAVLDDGTAVETGIAVAALGTLANTDWLADSGLAADPRGLRCDPFLRALDADGTPRGDVLAAGDVVRWPHPVLGNRSVSIQHWDTAVRQAETAAANALADPERPTPFVDLPAFWSSLLGVTVKSVGFPAEADAAALVQGSTAERRFAIAYGQAGRMVGAVTLDAGKWLPFYGHAIAAGAAFPPPWATIDPPPEAAAAHVGFGAGEPAVPEPAVAAV